MANYNTIPVSRPKRNKQKNAPLSIGTTDFGRIQPIYTCEVLPGDKISLKIKSFIRAAPPSVPVYGRLKVHTDAFFVPYRILWSEWDNYIAGNTNATPPFTTLQTLQEVCKIGNRENVTYESESEFRVSQDYERIYTGLRYASNILNTDFSITPTTSSKRISTLPIRAYKLIWWDYFRDSVNISENVKSTYIKISGSSDAADRKEDFLRPDCIYRCFGKDYLTTGLPSANGSSPGSDFSSVGASISTYSPSQGVYGTQYNPQNTVFNNQTTSPLIPVQALRAANALQRYMEKNNIVGTRLISRLLARFGVAPSAERLQRAEWLGQHEFIMNVSDIDSTESTDMYQNAEDVNVYNAFGSAESFANIRGQSTGKITGGANSDTFHYNATEFGIIIITQTVMPDDSYYQGIDRSLIRGLSTPNADRFDYFTPEFENLGYQPILASDVYFPGKDDDYDFQRSYNPNKVFGFQPRYEDYKYQKHLLYGDFVSTIFNTGMDSFHLFRNLDFFGQSPNQNEMRVSATFNTLGIEERLQFDRIFQIPSTKVTINVSENGNPLIQVDATATLDHFQLYNKIEYDAGRPMTGDTMPELVAGENDNDGQRISVPNGGIRL